MRALVAIACSFLALGAGPALGAPARAATPPEAPAPGEVAELGRVAHAAELCGLDAPARVSRQAGLQVAALTSGEPSPEAAFESLEGFGEAADAFREEYEATDEPGRSRLCAVAWLSWRAMREASPMTAREPNMAEAVKLAANAGSVHGALWSCHERGLLGPATPPSRAIAGQAGMVLALAALNSSTLDELEEALGAWNASFTAARDAQARSDESAKECASIALSSKALGLAFARRGEIPNALERARASRIRALGPKI